MWLVTDNTALGLHKCYKRDKPTLTKDSWLVLYDIFDMTYTSSIYYWYWNYCLNETGNKQDWDTFGRFGAAILFLTCAHKNVLQLWNHPINAVFFSQFFNFVSTLFSFFCICFWASHVSHFPNTELSFSAERCRE